MLKRTRPPHQGLWNAPGGKLRPGEDSETACRRELLEETGLTPLVRPAGMLDCLDRLRPGWVYRLHLFTASHQRVTIDPSEEGEFAWLPLARVLAGKGFVHNIPLFLPAILTGQSIQARFNYAGSYLETYSVNFAAGGQGFPISTI